MQPDIPQPDMAQPVAPAAPAPVAGTTPNPAQSDKAEQPVKLDGHTVSDPVFAPESEDDELLFGPTERPNDTFRAVPTGNKVPPPKNIEKYMPVFLEAARQPDAPPELQRFLRLLAYHMGQ